MIMTNSELLTMRSVTDDAGGAIPGGARTGQREEGEVSDAVVRAWVRDMRRRGLSSGTIEKRESVARRVVAYTGRALLDLSREDIGAWLDSRPSN